jgi:hypothetical protein
MMWFQSKWYRELACWLFGHAPAFASLNLPNCCITCKRPMVWNDSKETWDVLPQGIVKPEEEYRGE